MVVFFLPCTTAAGQNCRREKTVEYNQAENRLQIRLQGWSRCRNLVRLNGHFFRQPRREWFKNKHLPKTSSAVLPRTSGETPTAYNKFQR